MADDAELVEQLADLAHEQWSGWMEYLFERTIQDEGGRHVVHAPSVERWKRQMATPYGDLPDDEKESDRVEARRVLAVVQAWLGSLQSGGGRRESEAEEEHEHG